MPNRSGARGPSGARGRQVAERALQLRQNAETRKGPETSSAKAGYKRVGWEENEREQWRNLATIDTIATKPIFIFEHIMLLSWSVGELVGIDR